MATHTSRAPSRALALILLSTRSVTTRTPVIDDDPEPTMKPQPPVVTRESVLAELALLDELEQQAREQREYLDARLRVLPSRPSASALAEINAGLADVQTAENMIVFARAEFTARLAELAVEDAA